MKIGGWALERPTAQITQLRRDYDKRNKEQSNNVEANPCIITFANPKAIDYLFFLHRSRQLTWRAFGLGVALSSFADKDTGKSRLSRHRLSQITGIHSRDITRVIQELEKAHFFTVTHYVGRLNSYTLTLERPTTRGDKPETGGRTAVEPVGELPPISISKKQNKQTADWEKHLLAAKKCLKKVEWSDSCFIISEQVIDSLTTAFPAVDITAEVAKAHSWCSLNPDKAPSRDYGGFLFRWMTKVKPSDNAGEIAFAAGYIPPDSSLLEAIELEFERESRRADNE